MQLREPETAMSTSKIYLLRKAMKLYEKFLQDAWLQRLLDPTIEL